MTQMWSVVGGCVLIAVAVGGIYLGGYTSGHYAGFERGWKDRGLDCVNSGGTIDEEQDGYHYVPWWRRRRLRGEAPAQEPTPAQLPSVLELEPEYDGEAAVFEAPRELPAQRPCEVN